MNKQMNLLQQKTPRVGLEPTTPRLTAVCSTIELSRNTLVILIPVCSNVKIIPLIVFMVFHLNIRAKTVINMKACGLFGCCEIVIQDVPVRSKNPTIGPKIDVKMSIKLNTKIDVKVDCFIDLSYKRC